MWLYFGQGNMALVPIIHSYPTSGLAVRNFEPAAS
jgi:hypothetical protein